jgi:23S rRNA (cytosine1962-C5)-methyltransferase
MQQPFEKISMFRNRLDKVYRHISRQAKRQHITCYRVYDHDLPEFPLMLEIYDDKLYVAEYRRKHGLSDEMHALWLNSCLEVMEDVLKISSENIFIRVRQKKSGRQGQYQKLDVSGNEFIVNENGYRFIVNLSDYLDTGLFLDHRMTRNMVKELSRDKKVLNLFCYTGSFSVYAAGGGAKSIDSVDLSKTYLQWTERNMELNFPSGTINSTIHADVMQLIPSLEAASYDLIILDPPTFSNSKRMEDILDVQRDHVMLINQCLRLLNAGGILFFSTNYTRFHLESEEIHSSDIRDITSATTPFDFAGKLKRKCFRIGK